MSIDLNRTLNSVGKTIFIKYYYQFKNNDNLDEILPSEFTEKSKKSRASKGKAIFNYGLNIEALKIIIDSSRINDKIRNLAKEIIIEESNQ